MNNLRMNSFGNRVIKNTVVLISIFMLGIVVGYELDNNAIKWIQGFSYSLFNGSATNSNATDCNATDSNATSSNATSSNATSSNATSSNATSSNTPNSSTTSSNEPTNVDGTGNVDNNTTNDTIGDSNQIPACQSESNYIGLSSLKFSKDIFDPGARVDFVPSVYGGCLTGGTITFGQVMSNGEEHIFTVDFKVSDGGAYFVLPAELKATYYQVNHIDLYGTNLKGEKFTAGINGEQINKEAGDDVGLPIVYVNPNVESEPGEDNEHSISTDKDDVVTFQKSNIVNLLLVGLGAIFVIVFVIIIIIVKKKNKDSVEL